MHIYENYFSMQLFHNFESLYIYKDKNPFIIFMGQDKRKPI